MTGAPPKPFKPYTSLQEMFDVSATHLLAQGKRANDGGLSGCRYRSNDGCKCAVGALIPDELYTKELEGRMASTVLAKLEDQLTPLWDQEPTLQLLRRLQYVHDCEEPAIWREHLGRIAMQHGLDPKVLAS